MHVVLYLKAEIHDRAALARAALAALERMWGRPANEDRQALVDPARALYELLWASHPVAGPRQAAALGFEVVESEYETYAPPEPGVGRARANDKEVDVWHDWPARPSAASSRRRPGSSRRSAGS